MLKTTQINGTGPSESAMEVHRALRETLGDVMDGMQVHYLGQFHDNKGWSNTSKGWAHDAFDVRLPDGASVPWKSGVGHRKYYRSGKPEEHPEYGIVVAQAQRMLERPPTRDFDPDFMRIVKDDYFHRQWRRYIMAPSHADILYSLHADASLVEYSIDELAREMDIDKPSEAIRIHTAVHESLRSYNSIVPYSKREAVADILSDY